LGFGAAADLHLTWLDVHGVGLGAHALAGGQGRGVLIGVLKRGARHGQGGLLRDVMGGLFSRAICGVLMARKRRNFWVWFGKAIGFFVHFERENGDSWTLQLRSEDLMVLRIVSHVIAAEGSIVGF
jgi:hypothetical protein